MTRTLPLSWTLLLASLLLALLTPRAALADEPTLEFNGFKQLFLDQVGGKVEREVADAKKCLAAATDPAHRAALSAEVKELEALDRQVKDVAMIESLYGSIKQGYTAIDDLSKELDSGYSGESSINAALIAMNDLGGESRLKQLSVVTKGLDKGVDYFKKIKSLRDDLVALDAAELSPATQRLASQLTVMTSIMQNFGDKVPLIGDFIKAYGDVGGGLLKAAVALDKPIRESEQGELRAGVHGDRKDMLDKLHALGFNGAHALSGLRDAYVTDDQRAFVLWSRADREWAVADEPGLTAAELRRRYLFFVKAGTKNPTPEQVLRTFRRTVTLELEASQRFVAAGETVELVARATRALDGRQVDTAQVVIAVESHSGFDGGRFVGATRVPVGTPVRWESPASGSRSFVFVATLDTEQTAFHATEGARVRVLTGDATQVTLQAEPRQVTAGQEVQLAAQVTWSDGSLLQSSDGGWLTFTEATEAGYFRGGAPLADRKGARRVWVAPERPGTYTLRATYSGTSASGLFANHVAGSEATVTIQVQEPAWRFTITPATMAAKADAPAVFRATLHNDAELPQRFVIGGRTGPEAQRAAWSASLDKRGTLQLAPGAAEVLTIQAAPRSDDASRLQIEVRARPVGSLTHRSVIATATAEVSARQVEVQASGKQSRAGVGGKARWSGAMAPGATVTLQMQPWGEQRVFCTQGVLERNKNMRQVAVHSHGAGGCSWGTHDGRMHAAWKVDSEQVTWSGPGVRGDGTTATFTVPDKPGTYTVTARGVTRWSYERRAPGGTVRDTKVDEASATFTVTVR